MSNSVDQRIVEMVFDNAQFERGVSSTMASLKTLEQSLQMQNGAKGLEEIQRAADGIKFDNAAAQATGFGGALESLKNTASGVFSHIADAVGNMSTGIKVATGLLGSGLAGMMISGGWGRASNINEARFKLTGMYEAMAKEGEDASAKVNLAMKNATDAVDGTAYSLDSAAMAAANLAASGVEAGDQLYGTLRSIAGLAAMSGRDYDSVAQIVSTVAGQGKLMTMQLRQFEISGLNVAAVMAQAMDKSEEEIRDMVTAGDISFELFSEIMEEKFAGAAGKANETFSGSLANIRAALSRTLADFFELGQHGMVPIFNGIRMAINGVNSALGPLLGKEGVLTVGAKEALTAIGETMKAWFGYEEVYNEAEKKMDKKWFHQEELDHMTATVQGIADALKAPMQIMGQVMPNIVMMFVHFGAIIGEVLRLFGELVGPVFSAFRNVFSDNFFGVVSGWIAGLVKHIYDLVSALHIGRAYTVLLEGAFTVFFGIAKAVAGVIGTALTIAIRIVSDAFFVLVKSIEIVLDIIGAVLDLIGRAVGFFADLFDWVLKFSDKNSGFNLIANTFKNIATAIGMIIDVISGKEGAFESLVEFISGLNPDAGENLRAVGSAVGFLGECFANAHNLIQAGVELISDALYRMLQPAIPHLREGLAQIGYGIADFIKTFTEGFSSFIPEQLKALGEGIAYFIGAITGASGEGTLFDRIHDFFLDLRSNFENGTWMASASEQISKLAEGFFDFASSFKDKASEYAIQALQTMQVVLQNIGSVIGPVIDKIKSFGSEVGAAFGSFFESLGQKGIFEAVKAIGDRLLKAFGGVFDVVSEDLLTSIENAFSNAGSFIFGAFKNIFDTIQGFLSNIPSFLDRIGSGAMGFLESLGLDENTLRVLESIGNAFKNIVLLVTNIVRIVVRVAGFGIVAVLSAVGAALTTLFSVLKTLAPYVQSFGKSITDFFQSIANAFGAAGFTPEPFVNFANRVKNAIDTLVSGVTEGKDLKSMFSLFGSKIKTAFDSLFHNIGPKIKDLFGGIWTAIADNLAPMFESFFSLIGETLSNIPKLIGGAFSALDSFGAFEGLKNMGFEEPLLAIQNFFNETAPSKIKQIADGFGKFSENFKPAMEHLSGFKDGIIDAFKNAGFSIEPVKAFGKGLSDAFKNLFDAINDGTINSDNIRDFGRNVVESFKSIISDIAPKIGALFKGLWEALTQNIGGPLGDFLRSIGDKLSIIPKVVKAVIGSLDFVGIFDGLKNLDLTPVVNNIKAFFQAIGDSTIGQGIRNLLGVNESMNKVKDFFYNAKSIEKYGDRKRSIGDIWRKVVGGKEETQKIEESGDLVSRAIDKFRTIVQDPIGALTDFLSGAVKGFADGWAQMKEKLDTENIKSMIDDIVDIVKKAAGLALAWQGIKALNGVAVFFSTFERVLVSFKGMEVAVKNLVKTARYWLMANIVVEIAAALMLIVGAIALMAHTIKTNDPKQMQEALAVVVTLLIMLAAIPIVLGKKITKGGAKNVTQALGFIQGLSILIGELAAIIFVLGHMDQGAFSRGTTAVFAMLILIGALGLLTLGMDKAKIPNMKGTLTGIAIALAAITASVVVLGQMKPEQLLLAGAALVVLSTGLLLITKTINKAAKEISVNVLGFLVVAAAIGVLAGAVALLSFACAAFGPGVIVGFAVLALIVGVMVIAIKQLSSIRPDKMIEISASLITFAAAVLIIAGAIAGLAIVAKAVGDVAAFFGPLIALAGVIIALAVAVRLLSSAGPMAEASAGALTALAFAVGVIAIAIGALALLPLEKILVPFGMLIVIIAALVIAFDALAVSATVGLPGLMAVAAVLISFGAAAIAFGFAVKILVDSFEKIINTVSTVGPEFEEGLKRMGNALWNSKDEMARGVAGVIYAISSGFFLGISALAGPIGKFVSDIGRKLMENLPGLLQAAGGFALGFLKGLGQFIRDHGGEIKEALIDIAKAILEGIGSIFSDGINEFNYWLGEVTGGAMGKARPQAEAESKATADAMASSYKDGIKVIGTATDEEVNKVRQKLVDSNPLLKAAATVSAHGVTDGVTEGAKGFDFLKQFGLGPEDISLGFSELSEKLQSGGHSIMDFLKQGIESGALNIPGLDSILDTSGKIDISKLEGIMGEGGLAGVLAFGGGEEKGVAQLTELGPLLQEGGKIDQENISQQFYEAGKNAAESFGNAFSESLTVDASGPVEAAAKSIEKADLFRSSGKLNGRAAVDGFEDGLKQFASKSKDVADQAVKMIKDKKNPGHATAKETGKSIGDGLAAGLEAAWPAIRDACNKIIDKIDETSRKKAESHSPSRMTMRIGRDIGVGFAIGMEQMQGRVAAASASIVDTAEAGLAIQSSYLDGLLADIEERPVIRPVLDLSDYNSTLATMRGFDTADITFRSQLSNSPRAISSGEASGSSGNTNYINVYLNYDASADANQIVMDIAQGLETRLAMEGV